MYFYYVYPLLSLSYPMILFSSSPLLSFYSNQNAGVYWDILSHVPIFIGLVELVLPNQPPPDLAFPTSWEDCNDFRFLFVNTQSSAIMNKPVRITKLVFSFCCIPLVLLQFYNSFLSFITFQPAEVIGKTGSELGFSTEKRTFYLGK